MLGRINGALPTLVQQRIPTAKRFWEAVTSIPGFGEQGAKQKTLAAQPVVLKALAKLTYDFAFGRGADDQLLDRMLDGITDIDFSHDNPMWRWYELTPEERLRYGLIALCAHLPAESEGNRDIGSYQESVPQWVMRFGSKHNDIYPIIADMIRWTLGLPSRHLHAIPVAQLASLREETKRHKKALSQCEKAVSGFVQIGETDEEIITGFKSKFTLEEIKSAIEKARE